MEAKPLAGGLQERGRGGSQGRGGVAGSKSRGVPEGVRRMRSRRERGNRNRGQRGHGGMDYSGMADLDGVAVKVSE